MYRQMRETAQSMRRDGIDLPSANWTPPWEHVPDPNPSPDIPNRFGCVPACFGHPTYDGNRARKPVCSGDGRRFLPVSADAWLR
eukprot:484397-Pyramimonas_sp.AAC.1